MSAPLVETERQRLLRLRKAEHIDDYEHIVFLGYKPTRANLPTAERVAEWRREWKACNAPHE